MHNENKAAKCFITGESYKKKFYNVLNGYYFFDSFAKSHIKNPTKSLLWRFFPKIAINF